MKNKYSKLVVTVLTAVCFMGCQEDGIIYPEANAEVAATYLNLDELSQSTIQVQGVEGSHILKVKSDEKWTLSSSQAWCSPSDTEGFKYSQISLSFSENSWNEPRTAILTFVINETQEEKKVTVEQEASETTFATDVPELQYNIGGGEKSIELQTNAVEWEVEIIDEATNAPATWCSVTPATGKGKTTLKITAGSNATNVLRKAKLVFTAADKSLSVPIIQVEKLDAPVVNLEDNDAFLLSWDEITGVDGYKLKYITSLGENTIDIPSGTISYDLNLIDWNGYVGMISVQLFSYANVGGGAISQMGSEVINVHNLFDDASGNGGEYSEYIITKPRHLRNVNKYLDKHYKQTADIDLANVDFSPICADLVANVYTGNFTGVYDAAKGSIVDANTKRSSEQYKIKNWTLSKGSNSNCGLFANIGTEGIVRNVSIENAVITGKAKVGAIAGSCLGKVISCHTIGSSNISTSATTDTEIHLGGIVGYLTEKGEVSYCSNAATIDGSAGCVGGVVGMVMRDANNAPAISYCINSGNVVCNNKSPLGGVVGSMGGTAGTDPIKVTTCINIGNVSGSQANNQVAGIVGRAVVDTEISQSYNAGSITAAGSAAGIIGRMGGNSATIRDCYNAGSIKSTGTVTNGNSNAAGILATCTVAAAGTMTIENCHNTGNMETANGASQYNGLFHRTDGKISQITMKSCFTLNEGSKSQSNSSDSYISGGSSNYKNLSVSDMKNTSSFTGWDFSTIWKMGSEYPTLQALSK
ncbi:hypothetical protein GGR21_000292 [Dysgonomonas hofstadii]|uniref:BACON domain-containing protein n=1 Tax=Dysgonomonas hofstadii TaxID=637886 RepID=A0A840CEJ7_9BACT|nr:BACON domain-containing protein [Dysgonomonas hofstadii]MBB4034407.1 hypothetical protein [Dysgonomonas hofstadii]